MHKPSSFRDYVIATLIAAAIVVFFALYLFFRRGYLFDGPPTADMLYIPNKALASGAMVMIALTFLIGPVTRFFDRFDHWLSYRKEIGIVAGFLAVAHGVISYYLLPKKFPQEWVEFSTPEFGAGLVGAVLLAALFVFSWKRIILLVGGGPWWFIQRWGLRIVVVATLVHVYAMKLESWVRWFQQGGSATAELTQPAMPALGLLTTLFITWVVIVRLYESLFLFRDFGWKTKEISMDSILKARGRRFFLTSLSVLVVLYVIIIIRSLAF